MLRPRACVFIKANLPYLTSVFFLVITLVKLVLLCVFYDEAVTGMSRRFESIVPVSPRQTSWGLIAFSVLFGLWFCFLCLADNVAMATLNGVDLSKYGCIRRISCIGSHCSMTILSVLIRFQTILWAIVLALIAVLCSLGVIFIKSTNALCTESARNESGAAGNCIDLSALKPAVALFTDKPAQLTFCDANRRALCSHTADDAHLTRTFFHCFMVGVLVLIGLLHFLINMVASKNRYHQLRFMRKDGHLSNGHQMNGATAEHVVELVAVKRN